MAELLYLDTARLGRMSPGAQRVHRDFVRLAGEEGCSLYFERFLRRGLSSCPLDFQDRFPGLECWQGPAELKRSLRLLTGHPADSPVLLANRSAQLMKLAARLLFHPCRNVLTTDLGWPGYHAILDAEARRANRAVTMVAIRDDVLAGRLGSDELIDRVCRTFADRRCDGLFLTAVASLGVYLPAERIVGTVAASHRVWLVVIDGAQDFCHTAAGDGPEYYDLYLAGCHKWLGAYFPMGIAFYGRPRSRAVVETLVHEMSASGDLDDPLLRYSAALESGGAELIAETVNLTSLFAARGAITDAEKPADVLPARLSNVHAAAETASAAGWTPLLPAPKFRSGIFLVRNDSRAGQAAPPERVRTVLRDVGVAASTYDGGLLRLSMPPKQLIPGELGLLRSALDAARQRA